MSLPTDSGSGSGSDRVQNAAKRIEADSQGGHLNLDKVHQDLKELSQADTTNGQLDKAKFKTDLAAVTAQLHQDGVLPQLDLVENGNSTVGARGISTPSTSPGDGKPSLITKEHGTTFTYDQNNHVTSWSKGGDTWKYSSKDGKYHEFDHGKDTGKSTADVVTVGATGLETATHPDGSTTTTARWGGTVDRNADGQVTQETSGKTTKTFAYDSNGQLKEMTVDGKGQDKTTYDRAADGKFYASTDKDHKNPLDIQEDPKHPGVIQVTDKNGNRTDEHLGGTDVHWDKDQHLTSIDYSNGNKADKFTYDDKNQLTGFSVTGKDGKTHVYAAKDGMVTVDGGTPVKGTLEVGPQGGIKVTETGDGTDQQFKQLKFGLSGAEVQSAKYGDKILPVEVTNGNGKENSYKYDASGNLTEVDSHGLKLHMKGKHWVGADGKPVDVTPVIDEHGNFSIVNPDGTYTTWSPSGTKIEGIPDTPQAITKESKDAGVDITPDTTPTTPNPTDNPVQAV